MTKAAIALDMLLSFLLRSQQIAQVLQNAQLQGRDVTEEELDRLAQDDDAAREQLQKLIEEKKGN